MQRDYINIDLITERKLICHLNSLKGKIPVKLYYELKSQIEIWGRNKRIYLFQLEKVIKLLNAECSYSENKTIDAPVDGYFNESQTINSYSGVNNTNTALQMYMNQCDLMNTILKIHLLFSKRDNNIIKPFKITNQR